MNIKINFIINFNINIIIHFNINIIININNINEYSLTFNVFFIIIVDQSGLRGTTIPWLTLL